MSERARSAVSRLPPYARELLIAKRRRLRIDLIIAGGDYAWRRAAGRAPPHTLCCPSIEAFEEFDWSCVDGLAPTLVVWNRAPEHVDRFARHLVTCGAASVAAIMRPPDAPEFLHMVTYRPVEVHE